MSQSLEKTIKPNGEDFNEKRIAKRYIFLDESGKPEVFSTKGRNLVTSGHATRFLVIASVRCDDQLMLQQDVTDFRSSLLRNDDLKKIFSSSYALDAFHATADYPEVRERFYAFIKDLEYVKVEVIVVEKLKCFEPLQQDPGRMYGIMAGQLLKNLCHQAESTEIIFSRKDSKLKAHNELEREVDNVRSKYIQLHPNLHTKAYLAYHHNPHYSHGGLQIADYIAYATFQVFENENRKWFDIVKDRIGKVHDICNKKYFTRNNPL